MTPFDLAGRRFVVTGVLTRASIAFGVASELQRLGASVVLTSFGRTTSLTERAARRLPRPADVIELDVNDRTHLENLGERVGEMFDGLDGVLHSIAAAPRDAIDGSFLATPRESAVSAFTTSAYSLNALTAALLPLLACAQSPGAAVVALDFDAARAWPGYDWMGVAKAALESVARYLAREAAEQRVRVNLISAGPLATAAASGYGALDVITPMWERAAPLGWDATDHRPVAGAACYLLSPWSAGITGALLHVDGGVHAIGAPGLDVPARAAPADSSPTSVATGRFA